MKGEVLLWDYGNHQQFFLEDDYLQRLLSFVRDPVFQPENPIDQHLLQEKIFVENLENTHEKWGWDVISQIFHVGTKDIPLAHSCDDFGQFITEYVQFCEEQAKNGLVDLNTEKEGEIYTLPTPSLNVLDKTLGEVLQNRMTSRFFDREKSLTLDEVSCLLYATFGQIHGSWKEFESLGLQTLALRKSSPSAGGLHATEAYIVASNIEGLPRGIYHYRSHQHVLSLISSDWNPAQLGSLLAGQAFAEDLPLGVFMTSRFEKLWEKYRHSRNYRLALLDVGHLSQTFHLCATAMGLESWLTGIFLDTDINRLLKIDNTSEQMLFFVGAGRGNRQFLDTKTLAFLKSQELQENKII